MTLRQMCPRCGGALEVGETEVFCPVCALRRALELSEKQCDPGAERVGSSQQHYEQIARIKNSDGPGPGDVIEDYEILEKIGGNMGMVFKARHRLLDKVVALKLLPTAWISDAARIARFEREMRVMGQLAHVNLVTAVDARRVDQWHLVAMEWIEGVDLQRLVRGRGPLPIQVACEAIRQAALALQFAHEHGLIHRDVKPSNLMLTSAGTIKVIDLGLAMTPRDSTAALTDAGVLLGTMMYCAPEQFRDASSVDIRADIYSLGCTLHHLLTGREPYGERKAMTELMQAHLNEPLSSVSEFRPDAPAKLEVVIERMTAKDPAARFSTPAAVATALEPFSQGADLGAFLRAQPAGPVVQVRMPRRQIAVATDSRYKPRRSWLVGSTVLVLLLAMVGAGFLIAHPMERNPVVVLMDTTAPGGVYDEENRISGGTNAEELYKVLHPLLPNSLQQMSISSKWDRESQVLAMRPRLVVVHRSSFFHSLNAELKFGSPPFTYPAEEERWKVLYRIGDERMRSFIGWLGTSEPRTKFLVYSRGTDENWLNPEYREQWKNEIEDRFPKLKGRITTMLIPGEKGGTFRDRKTAEEMRKQVKAIIGLQDERE